MLLPKGLKIINNTIMTVAGHPSGVKKYSTYHKQVLSMFDEVFGGSGTVKACEQITNGHILPNADKYSSTLDKIWDFMLVKGTRFGANIPQQVGKRKIPRYLYHITTKENWQKIQTSGKLEPRDAGGCGSGLYMFELQNMIKNYGDRVHSRGLSRLLGQGALHTVSEEKELVLLRIPTEKLNAQTLAIRSNGFKSGDIRIDGLTDSAINSQLYKQRKYGLEYITPESVNASDIQVLGSTRFSLEDNYKLVNSSSVEADNIALRIWKELTEGFNERKAFDRLG